MISSLILITSKKINCKKSPTLQDCFAQQNFENNKKSFQNLKKNVVEAQIKMAKASLAPNVIVDDQLEKI